MSTETKKERAERLEADRKRRGQVRWPWRLTITRDDGTVREENYAAETDVIGLARHLSMSVDVACVELAAVFMAGEIVTPADEHPSRLWPCGCLINDAGAHRAGCPDDPEGVRG